MDEPTGHVIRASDVGLYTYCARAWWLGSVEGRPSAHARDLAAGRAVHRRHGVGVRRSLWLRRLAHVALLLAAVCGVAWWLGWPG